MHWQKYADILFRDLTTFGGAVFYALIVLLAFAFSQTTLAVNLILGFVISLIILLPIRLVYFKNRPQKQTYSNLLERIDAASFPSWHTARIAFMTLAASFHFKNIVIAVMLLILTCLVGYSRFYLKKHDWNDIMGGVVLGAVTYGVVRLL